MSSTEETITRWRAEERAVRALTDAVPLVRAEGKLIHHGRLYAHGSTTCLVFDQP
jgi:hypothetical protein